MKISIEDINKIIDECKSKGYDFVMSDLMYAILHPQFKDKAIIYYSLFGKGASETEISDYDISPKMSFLKKYVNKNILKKRTSTKDSIDEDEILEDILKPVRGEDERNDLWTVFNICQEKLIKGGYKSSGQKGKMRKQRAITSIKKEIDYNQQFWQVAETFLSRRAA